MSVRSFLMTVIIIYAFLVSGEANFVMSSTRLTVGGFTQPGVARNVTDIPANSEKGLSHRFIWTFPRPIYGKFESLSEVNKSFGENIGKSLRTGKTMIKTKILSR